MIEVIVLAAAIATIGAFGLQVAIVIEKRRNKHDDECPNCDDEKD